MLHALGRELEAKLVAKGCPYKVVDREPRGMAITYTPRIVIEANGDDKFGPPRSQSINPKRHYTRTLSCKLTIYGKSLKPGAQEFEHRRIVEQVLDLVLVGLRYVAAVRFNGFDLTGGRFIVPEDLAKSEIHAGAAYELSFIVERAVAERTWDGDKRPEGTLAGLNHATKVSQYRGPDDDDNPNTPPATAEVACGGA